MIIDHIGIVVSNLDEAVDLWSTRFGYKQLTKPIINTRQKVRVVFMQKEKSILIKLVEPVDKTSPVYAFSARGGGLHHLCFKCDSLNAELDRLKEMGMRLLTPPQPGEAFENNNIAFVYAGNGLNIELIDTDVKAGRISQSGGK